MSGTSIQGVLGEFLYHRGGAVYYLTCCYLLGYQGIEYRYLTQKAETSIRIDYRSNCTGIFVADYLGSSMWRWQNASISSALPTILMFVGSLRTMLEVHR
jgi:hypothetical protein